MEQELLEENGGNNLEWNEDVIIMHDFDMNHKRRPLVLMQTAGHVSGAAYYYRRNKKEKTAEDKGRKIERIVQDSTKGHTQQNQLKLKGNEINNVQEVRKESLITNRCFNQGQEEFERKSCFIFRKEKEGENDGDDKKKDSDLFHHHLQVYGNKTSREEVLRKSEDGGDRFDGCLKENVMSCGKKIESFRNDDDEEIDEKGMMMTKMKGGNNLETVLPSKEKEEEKDDGYLTGVSIHPKFGGWFAFRAVLVFPRIQVEKGSGLDVQVDPLDLLTSEEEKEALITSFIQDWKSAEYRNVIQPVNVYSERQKRYFDTKPKHRIPLLMTFFRENLTSREFVLGH